ncbi:MAG TPA: hypothetical protein DCQ58_05205 [Saprospirales bacterium]|nr:hypothetical protein [Saprospirales bacterium]
MIHEFGFSENEANLSIEKIQNFSEEYQLFFMNWFLSRTIPSLKVGSFDFEEYMQEFDKNPIEVFILFNWMASNEEVLKIAEKLIQLNYQKNMVERTVKKILRFESETKALFDDWLEYGNEPEITVENYTYRMLIDTFEMKPIGAFITLNWLIIEPETAKAALAKGKR